MKWAREKGVHIHYVTKSLEDFTSHKLYDAVGLIYVHLPYEKRRALHREVTKSLKPGGYLVLEAFAKEQLEFGSGGPRDVALLYDAPSLCNDFSLMHLISCGQKEIFLEEGAFHQGRAAVMQMIGQKL